jgi:glycosyltransferase involved in cell wall biosynthesis
MYALGQLDGIFFLCSEFQRQMTARGLEATKTEVLLAGADPSLFLGHERRDGAVGLCTAYYERKDPDRIFRIAQRMPHRRFLLVGRNWNKYPRIAQISKLPNFEYVESPYERYPELYARMDVFLSPARLEGGPVPLLEAMMSNAVPVASRTGFAPDLIKYGLNGYLFDADAPIDDICALIDLAYEHTSDIRETVMDLTWDRLANRVRTWLE